MSCLTLLIKLLLRLDSMAIDVLLRGFRISADFLMDTIGLIYWPQRKRLPPLTEPLLLKSATECTALIRTGQVCLSDRLPDVVI